MNSPIKLLLAQINPTVGAIKHNTRLILNIIAKHQSFYDLIIFPELCLTGYPPEDLLLHDDFYQQTMRALQEIQQQVASCHVIIGHPFLQNDQCYNSASVFFQGQLLHLYHKQILPNYGVFDEKRYFTEGPPIPTIMTIENITFGLCICEDIWAQAPINQYLQNQVDYLICINASPFDYEKYSRREFLLTQQARKGIGIIYVNQVGGQDELVFDGQSMSVDATGTLTSRAASFTEVLETITIEQKQMIGTIAPLMSTEALIYQALVCGLRDYVEKNKFPGVLLGLSGGIDSALTLAIAVDALGPSRVHAVLMPSRYTAKISIDDALQQVNTLGVQHSMLSIEPTFNTILTTLTPLFSGKPVDVTEENIQARIRGLLLMALSNKSGYMVLATSNKSESAVGYATLYGDMVGGFSVLKDVLKTQVYALAHYRNTFSANIPERVLTRPPSAELAENQVDQDSLPDYAILDAIITYYVEYNFSAAEIAAQGYPLDLVESIIRRIRRNEYKRRQAAPGVKISSKAFDKDWRYPITSGF